MATYYGTDGDDTFVGTVANDIFHASKGTDRFNGGSGPDQVSFETWGRAVTIDLAYTGFQLIGPGSKIRLTSFESVIGSRYADTLYGTTDGNVMYGGKGGDVIYGRDGDDALFGDSGNDMLNGGSGRDTLIGGVGDDTLIGGAGNDLFSGGAGTDLAYFGGEFAGITLDLRTTNQQYLGSTAGSDSFISIENVVGTVYADALIGSDANNTLYGNGGNDVLEGGAGDDVLSGETGIDTASYEHATGGVIVSMFDTGVQAVGGGAGADQLIGIENVRGSAYDDVFYGNGDGNGFDGGAGTDWVFYTSRSEHIAVYLFSDASGAGDTLTNIENIVATDYGDYLYGDTANNALYGQGGNDLLRGDLGDDTLNGGVGVDEVEYTTAAAKVTVDLAITGAQNTGGDGTDIVQAVENLTGSSYDDTLSGNDSSNRLTGRAGIDVLNGRGGNDTLVGGFDADILTGGAGADEFRIDSVGDSLPGFLSGDYIQDFSRAQQDRIQLGYIDARTDQTGDDYFTFIGNAAFSGVAGQLRFDYANATNQYVIYADVNGDKAADMAIYVVSDSAAPVATDFFL